MKREALPKPRELKVSNTHDPSTMPLRGFVRRWGHFFTSRAVIYKQKDTNGQSGRFANLARRRFLSAVAVLKEGICGSVSAWMRTAAWSFSFADIFGSATGLVKTD